MAFHSDAVPRHHGGDEWVADETRAMVAKRMRFSILSRDMSNPCNKRPLIKECSNSASARWRLSSRAARMRPNGGAQELYAFETEHIRAAFVGPVTKPR